MAELSHSAVRMVQQRPEVVHARLLELAARLRDEAPPIEPGTQAATLLGISGPLGIEFASRGPRRIELRTTRGRVRAQGAALLEDADGGARTRMTLGATVRPEGFAANLMFGAALAARPDIERQVVAGLERGLDDLVAELEKPDGAWDAGAWWPPGLPPRGSERP
jgi:hypothetical protein